MKVYQAGPLFSEAERDWHLKLKRRLLEAGYNVVWPYELVPHGRIGEWGGDAPAKIMELDAGALDKCHVVVALLDGAQVDDGTAWEIGYAYAKGIPVIGIRTDFRNGGDTASSRVNAMVQGSCRAIVGDVDALLASLATVAKP